MTLQPLCNALKPWQMILAPMAVKNCQGKNDIASGKVLIESFTKLLTSNLS